MNLHHGGAECLCGCRSLFCRACGRWIARGRGVVPGQLVLRAVEHVHRPDDVKRLVLGHGAACPYDDTPTLQAFLVWLASDDDVQFMLNTRRYSSEDLREMLPGAAVIHHYDEAAARAEYMNNDFVEPDAWRRLRSRRLGSPIVSASLQQINRQRGRNDLHEGQRVSVAGAGDQRPLHGVVAGSTGGYICVLADERRHPLVCHPGDVWEERNGQLQLTEGHG